jgi:hypothetical protein
MRGSVPNSHENTKIENTKQPEAGEFLPPMNTDELR